MQRQAVKRTTTILLVMVFTLLPMDRSMAVGPGKGEMTKHNVEFADCVADSVTVKWNLDTFFGEPVVYANYRYESTDPECKPHYSSAVLLRVESGGGFGHVISRLSNPSRPGKWGFNVSGSPDWDELLCGYVRQQWGCKPEEEAKRTWLDGKVTDVFIHWEEWGEDAAERDEE